MSRPAHRNMSRDALRNAAAARADRKQRDLGDYMLNHPENKP
jgi:hypothetical protein